MINNIINKIAVYVVCLVVGCSLMLQGRSFNVKFYYGKDSSIVVNNYNILDYCLPVEVVETFENDKGYFCIKTIENSFVKAPINADYKEVCIDGLNGYMINKLGVTAYMLGLDFIYGTKNYACGEVCGKIDGNILYVKLYKGSTQIDTDVIKEIFNV